MTFSPGDWVLKKATGTSEHGKLDTNQKGLYVVGEITSKGAYFLYTIEGE